MKFLVELDTINDEQQTQDEWALWVLKCICAHIKPHNVRDISVIVAEPARGDAVQ